VCPRCGGSSRIHRADPSLVSTSMTSGQRAARTVHVAPGHSHVSLGHVEGPWLAWLVPRQVVSGRTHPGRESRGNDVGEPAGNSDADRPMIVLIRSTRPTVRSGQVSVADHPGRTGRRRWRPSRRPDILAGRKSLRGPRSDHLVAQGLHLWPGLVNSAPLNVVWAPPWTQGCRSACSAAASRQSTR
jgi:hypothetical protein